jgi:integrase
MDGVLPCCYHFRGFYTAPKHTMQTIWQRIKNGAGNWRYQAVEEGRGKRTGDLEPPFYVRPTVSGGRRIWHKLGAKTFSEAKQEAEQFDAVLDAAARGLTVAEAENLSNINRTPIETAVENYLAQKASKAAKTVAQYTNTLNQFTEAMTSLRVKFLDEITESILRKYKAYLEREGYAGKTIDTRLNIVYFMLKKNGIAARLPKDEMPTVEEEPAVPYDETEIRKLFAVMTDEEAIRYKFFLGTGCRDKEVSFAAWSDIDFTKRTYHIRRKEDVGFTPKSHESRTVPMPASLVEALKARRKQNPNGRWIFVNTEGNPDNHFLRKLKQIARRAGLNCGLCETCNTSRECEHFYLHRFRKTCATRWVEAGVSIRNVQAYLGHKSLEVTQRYVGVTDTVENRKKIDQAFGD